MLKQLSSVPCPAADLSCTDDYTANAIPNRYYTGLPGGQVIQPTLNPIATSYQPRVRTTPPQCSPKHPAGIMKHASQQQNHVGDAPLWWQRRRDVAFGTT